jgi:NAD(P)-dependent dehydrogenase (short-subunit alcohol dehydrogenase family)
MKISDSVALVTGANRGIGRAFAQELLARGAAKVYATARRPELVDIPGVEVLRLDITDPASVAAAAERAADVNLLINNAGIATRSNLVAGDLGLIRQELDTHFYGTLNVIRAFAPALAGGAILNVLSVLAWTAFDGAGSYSAAKAAQWGLTNAVRLELAPQGTLVTGLLLGAADTDMMAGFDVEKAPPGEIARRALDGIEAGDLEVLADEAAVQVKAALAADPRLLYPQAA